MQSPGGSASVLTQGPHSLTWIAAVVSSYAPPPSYMWLPCSHPAIVQHRPQDEVWVPNSEQQLSATWPLVLLLRHLFSLLPDPHQFPAHILCCFLPVPLCLQGPKSHPLSNWCSSCRVWLLSARLRIHLLGVAKLLSSHSKILPCVHRLLRWGIEKCDSSPPPLH